MGGGDPQCNGWEEARLWSIFVDLFPSFVVPCRHVCAPTHCRWTVAFCLPARRGRVWGWKQKKGKHSRYVHLQTWNLSIPRCCNVKIMSSWKKEISFDTNNMLTIPQQKQLCETLMRRLLWIFVARKNNPVVHKSAETLKYMGLDKNSVCTMCTLRFPWPASYA